MTINVIIHNFQIHILSKMHWLILPSLISDATAGFWLSGAAVAVLTAADIWVGLYWWHICVAHVTSISRILLVAVVVVLVVIILIPSVYPLAHGCALQPLFWSVHTWTMGGHVLVSISSACMCLIWHVVLISRGRWLNHRADVVDLAVFLYLW